MIILLDTSTAVCYLTIIDGDTRVAVEWEAGRELSKGLLSFMNETFTANSYDWSDISGIVVFRGPGSFTGLRIGITVLNTLAHAQHIPIVGVEGESWQAEGLKRLEAGDDDQLVMPLYGGEATITKPRK